MTCLSPLICTKYIRYPSMSILINRFLSQASLKKCDSFKSFSDIMMFSDPKSLSEIKGFIPFLLRERENVEPSYHVFFRGKYIPYRIPGTDSYSFEPFQSNEEYFSETMKYINGAARNPYYGGFNRDPQVHCDYSDSGMPEVFFIPCKQCLGCRQDNANSWLIRCYHETLMHGEENCSFLTLTYNDQHLTKDLVYADFQSFIKRFRQSIVRHRGGVVSNSGIRYVVAGEYGSQRGRPHFHVILFGIGIKELRALGKVKVANRCRSDSNFGNDKNTLYTSDIVDSAWEKKGMHRIGTVGQGSIRYVLGYCFKKSGSLSTRAVPEMIRYSTRPAIGLTYLLKYFFDFFPHGKCVFPVEKNGKIKRQFLSMPLYYLRVLKRVNPLMYADLYARRIAFSKQKMADICNGLSAYVRDLSSKLHLAKKRLLRMRRPHDAVN